MENSIFRNKNQKRYIVKKLRFIMDFGGKCKHCGKDLITHHYDADFHHLDPSKKEAGPASLMRKNYYEAKKEMNKCVLLCGACHRYEHYKWKDWEIYKDELLSMAKNVHKEKTKLDYNDYKENVKKLYINGNSIRKISKILNKPVTTIAYTVNVLGIKRANDITKVTMEEAIKCFELGMTAKEVSIKYNCDYANCARKKKKWLENKNRE